MKRQSEQLRKTVVAAMLCALAYLCVFFFRIKVGFLTFDAKDAVIAMLSLLYGPAWGLAGAVAVPLLELITVSDTGMYGFLMNVCSSGTFAVVCGSIYHFYRRFSGAIAAVAASVCAVTAVMMAANLVITPFYMGVSRAEVAGMIPTLLLPFNLCKSLLNAGLTLALYKPLTAGLRKSGLLPPAPTAAPYRFGKKSLLLTLAAVVLVAAAVAYFLVRLGGEVQLLPAAATIFVSFA